MTTATREKPILFSGPMVRAILAGRKTQTRRVVIPQPERRNDAWYWQGGGRLLAAGWGANYVHTQSDESLFRAMKTRARYKVGDVLWVRESFAREDGKDNHTVAYAADGVWGSHSNDGLFYPHGFVVGLHPGRDEGRWVWREYFGRMIPSIHMPRWASRIKLTVTGVWVEWLQDIGEREALQESFNDSELVKAKVPSDGRVYLFRQTWDALNADRGYAWYKNPAVFVYRFERITP